MDSLVTIKLTMAEWQVVLNHLGVGRYVDVAQLLDKIAAQLKASQDKEKEDGGS